MTAIAVRKPARWTNVIRAEAGMLLEPRDMLALLALAVVLTMYGTRRIPFADPGLLIFFLPFLQWRGRAERGPLDQALPVRPVAYDLIRLTCGAAVAALILGIITLLEQYFESWSYLPPEMELHVARGYWATVLVHGIAIYLFGSAVMLRARRPGRVLLVVFILAVAVLLLAGVELGPAFRLASMVQDGSVRIEYGTQLSLDAALLRLALATGTVWLAAWLGRHGTETRGWSLVLPRFLAQERSVAGRPRVDAASLRVPRAAAHLTTVAMRQFSVQARRMVWPLLVAAVLAALLMAREMGSGPTFLVDASPFALLWMAGIFWPALVWADARRRLWDWDGALPADPFVRRLAHAAGGLAWLQLATHVVLAGCVIGAAAVGNIRSAGEVPAWAWPGVPLAVLAGYLLATAAAVFTDHPIVGGLVILFGIIPAMAALAWVASGFRPDFLVGDTGPLSPTRVIAPLFKGSSKDWEKWSGLATAVWIPVFAALAAAALRRRVRLDRQGGLTG